jgi:hypothetical protein
MEVFIVDEPVMLDPIRGLQKVLTTLPAYLLNHRFGDFAIRLVFDRHDKKPMELHLTRISSMKTTLIGCDITGLNTLKLHPQTDGVTLMEIGASVLVSTGDGATFRVLRSAPRNPQLRSYQYPIFHNAAESNRIPLKPKGQCDVNIVVQAPANTTVPFAAALDRSWLRDVLDRAVEWAMVNAVGIFGFVIVTCFIICFMVVRD